VTRFPGTVAFHRSWSPSPESTLCIFLALFFNQRFLSPCCILNFFSQGLVYRRGFSDVLSSPPPPLPPPFDPLSTFFAQPCFKSKLLSWMPSALFPPPPGGCQIFCPVAFIATHIFFPDFIYWRSKFSFSSRFMWSPRSQFRGVLRLFFLGVSP